MLGNYLVVDDGGDRITDEIDVFESYDRKPSQYYDIILIDLLNQAINLNVRQNNRVET